VPEPRALKPDLLLLHLLLAPLAAALHEVCHSSLCRQSSAPSRARPCRALRKVRRKCGESARPEHWRRHPTGAPQQRTLPGTRIHLREHKRARCHPRPSAHRAARHLRTPPRACSASSSLGRRPALSRGACCACVLRWRATRVAARPPRGGLLPQRRDAAPPTGPQPSLPGVPAPRCRLAAAASVPWAAPRRRRACARRQAVAGQQAAAHSSRHGGGVGGGACARVGRRGAMMRQQRSALSCF